MGIKDWLSVFIFRTEASKEIEAIAAIDFLVFMKGNSEKSIFRTASAHLIPEILAGDRPKLIH